MHAAQTNNPMRWVLWSAGVVVALLFYLNTNPLELTEVEKRAEAEQPARRSGGEVLLVVDPEQVRRSAEVEVGSTLPTPGFEDVDWSYAWINTLEQEFGPYTLIDRGALRSTDLTPYRFVIITHSVAGQDADEDLLGHLRSYARAGGVLLFERPVGRIRAEFSADGGSGARPAKSISHVTGLEPPWSTALQSMPLFTPSIGSSGPAQGAVTYMAMDGVPVVYRSPVGRGFAITMEFNYGLQLMSLQQGRPRNDFTIKAKNGSGEHVQTSDLIAHPAMVDNPIPYADLLESYIVQVVLADSYPVMSMWPFSGGRLGAVLMTHDVTPQAGPEGEIGDDALWMAHWEKERQVRSTWFTTGEGLTPGGLRTLAGSRHSVQLAWVRHQAGEGLSDPVGLGPIQPLRRVRSLEEQFGDLKGNLPKKHVVVSNRSHRALWSEGYTDAFLQMVAVGIGVDTSYAPPASGRGYSFGTGLPFRALDTNGLPLPIMEHPLVVSETNGAVDLRYMHALLRDSQESYHQAIVVRFNPNTYRVAPSLELFDLWQTTYDMAEDKQHVMTTVPGFYRFWRQRLSADVRTRLRVESASAPPPRPGSDDRPAPSSPAEIGEEFDALTAEDPTYEPPAGRKPIIIDIEAKAPEEGHYLAFPGEVRGRRFAQARSGQRAGEGSDLSEPLRTITTEVLGRRLKLGRLRKGYNSITVTYR